MLSRFDLDVHLGLLSLCSTGHLDVVTYLVVDVDVDPHAVDGSGRTPLEVARRAGKEEVIRFLEQLDADKQREVDPLPLCAGPYVFD